MKSLRNAHDKRSIVERIESLTGDEKPLWGKMNVRQMVSHLVQSGEMPFEPNLPENSSFASRHLIKPLVLYVLPMPKEVKTSPELDQQEGGRPPQDFAEDKRLAIEYVMRLARLPNGHKCSYHPFFGPMTVREWGLIAYKHFDHHLRQFGV